METVLIAARVVHFAATVSLMGVFAFERLVAAPARRAAGAEVPALHPGSWLLAWASLGLLLLSGAAWLVAIAANLSGRPLAAVISGKTLGIVLTGTRFGEDWLLRLAGAVLVGLLLAVRRRTGARPRLDAALGWATLIVAALLLASLAWAGHGAATAGAAGDLHLAGDVVHLLAAGTWLGTLVPLALLLNEARHGREPFWPAAARAAARRFSAVAVASVALLLAGGIANAWFLAASVPALVGTEYGRLLLAKIALFLAMLVVAAFNLLRLTPRLAGAAGDRASRTAGQMRRNALIEAALGLGVLAIVGLLGILPPGLNAEPGWPFPFRLDLAALGVGATAAVTLSALLSAACAIAAVAAAAAGRYRTMAGLAAALVLCAGAGWLPLRSAVEPAYPTSFYAPAQPYAAAPIVRGARIYADNCAACHGATGKGNGPAAAGLPVHPTDLTEPHLLAHRPGDLFWWVSHGKGRVMPGFANVLPPDRRWDVINFIRARAAGELAQQVGPRVSAATGGYPVPDFAFEQDGRQNTLRRTLAQRPVLLVLYGGAVPAGRVRRLIAARAQLAAAGLHIIAVDVGRPAARAEYSQAHPPAPIVAASANVRAALALFRSPADGGETELLLDRHGGVHARWTANAPGGLPDRRTLAAAAARAARFAVKAPRHAGHH